MLCMHFLTPLPPDPFKQQISAKALSQVSIISFVFRVGCHYLGCTLGPLKPFALVSAAALVI